MEKTSIRRCSISEISNYSKIGRLEFDYAQESAVHGLGNCSAQWDLFEKLESSGALQAICAFYGSDICGFVTVVVTRHTHYESLIGSIESFFVSKEFRKSGVGLRLLRAARQNAQDRGAAGLLVNAPVGSRLDEVLARTEFEHSHNVYFRSFGNGF